MGRGEAGGLELGAGAIGALSESLSTTAYSSGSTHHFYHYPARFHPEVAREVISSFSNRNGWVLDPFMGGLLPAFAGPPTQIFAPRVVGEE